MHINKENALALLEKMHAISELPFVYEVGRFDGIDFDESSITYKSSTWFRCGTDTYTFYVDWDDINKPLEYFKKKFKDEYDAREKQKAENKKKEAENQEKRRVEDFYKLKSELGL